MARCEECLHFEVCEALEQGNGLMKVSPIHCGYYKNAADVAPKSEGEWISVEERLPDKEGTYLTYTDKDRMLFDSFCIYPSIGTKFWIGGNGKVTHWMPLPEAPKMKGGAG